MRGNTRRWLVLGVVCLAATGCGRNHAAGPQVDGGLPVVCAAGAIACFQDQVATCMAGGVGWTIDSCAQNQICVEGVCRSPSVVIATESLPDGMIGAPYSAQLEAASGVTPYVWSLVQGDLPPGVDLLQDGAFEGTPTSEGTFAFEVRVRDASGSTATASLSIVIHPEGLVITTNSLPAAQHGLAYAATLHALGGVPPYAWGISDGALPAGLILTSTGGITGAPSEIGTFTLTFRVFDNAIPTAWADRELSLTVGIAPLQIVGSQQIDLIVTKVIVLPLIVVVQGIPIPYQAQLQAIGGLPSYHWSEIDLSSTVALLIPSAGIPTGLTLEDDGTLHGAVTDASQIITITVPLSTISLTGFFFAAQVEDSQSPADQANAVYLLPTVPVGG
ncbi:MAG: putative Ig domain-containing protein [Deltaproteobacteria bacterium]|nr:putative Ig domain-containing protein [Deltaproteobacteria bacterium]